MKKARLVAGLELFEATPLGLEPRIKEPKSLVLPITPRSNHFLIKLSNLPNPISRSVYALSLLDNRSFFEGDRRIRGDEIALVSVHCRKP
jgi:hypothetical protein